MKKIILILTLLSLIACRGAKVKEDPRAIINTNRGIIRLYLYPEAAPLTVANFINLSLRGYYNGLTFHRVIEDFMIQGGDPEGTGKGGPGYQFKDEISDWLKFYDDGMLAMANAGPNTNGSQFFITRKPTEWLNDKHTVFGEVVDTADYDVVNEIKEGDIIDEIKITGDYQEILDKYKKQIDGWNKILDENHNGKDVNEKLN